MGGTCFRALGMSVRNRNLGVIVSGDRSPNQFTWLPNTPGWPEAGLWDIGQTANKKRKSTVGQPVHLRCPNWMQYYCVSVVFSKTNKCISQSGKTQIFFRVDHLLLIPMPHSSALASRLRRYSHFHITSLSPSTAVKLSYGVVWHIYIPHSPENGHYDSN